MSNYSVKEFDAIKNSCQYSYFLLYINERCQFEDFKKEIKSNAIYNKQYNQILATMEQISDQHTLTAKKFRNIKGVGRKDIFEFKSKDLRIYVLKKNPNMYIILGGYKANQDNDINLLKERLKYIEI